MTDAELEQRAPWIAWREPIRVERTDGYFGYACRYCIAHHGLKADDIEALPQTHEEVARHIREKHTQ
jgi:hypothetical protein